MKRLLTSIIILLCCCNDIEAQEPARHGHLQVLLNNAEKEFENLRYSYAIPYFQAYLRAKPDDSLANLHLAASFRLVKQFDSALLYYKHFISRYRQTEAAIAFAEVAATMQQYQLAVKTYQQLVLPDAYHKLVAERVRGFEHPEQFLFDSLDYTLQYLKLNTRLDEYGPQLFRNGLAFVSNRYKKKSITREFGWDGLPYAHIYWVNDIADLYTVEPPRTKARQYNNTIRVNDDYTTRTSNDNDIITVNGIPGVYTGSINDLPELSTALQASYNYGPLCFSSDGSRVYFTRNSKNRYAGRSNLEICESVLENGAWKKSRVLPFVDPEFDFYHPAISKDGKRLYFCSNKPGGWGGSDIYYVTLSGQDEFSLPVNPGGKINTPADELFPTLHGDTLYFSSNGHAGLGGLDLYKIIERKDRWEEPVNLGYPLNSAYDDFGIIFTPAGDKGFFASNRLGTDDIYAFSKTNFHPHLQGTVLDAGSQRKLPGVLVKISQLYANKLHTDSITTTLTGNFDFIVRSGYPSTATFLKEGFIPDTLEVEAPGTSFTVSAPPVFLQPQPLPRPEKEQRMLKDSVGAGVKRVSLTQETVLQKLASLAKSVYFKTGSAVIMPQSLLPLNEVVSLIKQYPEAALVIEGHTDNRGNRLMNSRLSQRRADAVKTYLAANGLAAGKLTAKGYGPDKPIADNGSEAGRAKNRRVMITAQFK